MQKKLNAKEGIFALEGKYSLQQFIPIAKARGFLAGNSVTPKPEPNGINICGDAFGSNCKGK